MDHRERFQLLNDAIVGGSTELGELFDDRSALWYTLALSDVTLLAGGSEVQLADTVVTLGEADDGSYSARITIFTEHLVITVDAAASSDTDTGSHTTSARSRADLRALEVAAETGALGDSRRSLAWPGKVAVTLDYGDAERLKLPGGKHADRVQFARVAALLPSLRADLLQ